MVDCSSVSGCDKDALFRVSSPAIYHRRRNQPGAPTKEDEEWERDFCLEHLHRAMDLKIGALTTNPQSSLTIRRIAYEYSTE